MPQSPTHNEWMLRPPPGTRFTIIGSDVFLQFPRGTEDDILIWMREWIDGIERMKDWVHPAIKEQVEKLREAGEFDVCEHGNLKNRCNKPHDVIPKVAKLVPTIVVDFNFMRSCASCTHIYGAHEPKCKVTECPCDLFVNAPPIPTVEEIVAENTKIEIQAQLCECEHIRVAHKVIPVPPGVAGCNVVGCLCEQFASKHKETPKLLSAVDE